MYNDTKTEMSEEEAKRKVEELWALHPDNPKSPQYKPNPDSRVRALRERYLREHYATGPTPSWIYNEEGEPIRMETWNEVLARWTYE